MIGGLGTGEIILIGIAVLVLFGAKKLPEIGKSLGKGLREFKKATNEISAPLKDSIEDSNNIIEHPTVQSDNTDKKDSPDKKSDNSPNKT